MAPIISILPGRLFHDGSCNQRLSSSMHARSPVHCPVLGALPLESTTHVRASLVSRATFNGDIMGPGRILHGASNAAGTQWPRGPRLRDSALPATMDSLAPLEKESYAFLRAGPWDHISADNSRNRPTFRYLSSLDYPDELESRGRTGISVKSLMEVYWRTFVTGAQSHWSIAWSSFWCNTNGVCIFCDFVSRKTSACHSSSILLRILRNDWKSAFCHIDS